MSAYLLMKLIVKLHQKYKKICKNVDRSGQVTAGHLLEKYCFGVKVDLDSISPLENQRRKITGKFLWISLKQKLLLGIQPLRSL